jgi:hypothetical protein
MHLEQRKYKAHILQVLDVLVLVGGTVGDQQLDLRYFYADEGVVVGGPLLHYLNVIVLQLVIVVGTARLTGTSLNQRWVIE